MKITICTKEIDDVPAIAATADGLAVEKARIVNAIGRGVALESAVDIDVFPKSKRQEPKYKQGW